MTETPEIVHLPARPAAVLPITVPRAEIRTVMGPGLRELMAAVAAQGVAPAGPWFTHHLRMDPEVFDFEIGVPVDAPVTAAGRVRAGGLPATRAARTVYRGPYEGLPAAWGQFETWLKAQGHTPAADRWEVYATGPNATPDPAAWQTEFYCPLVNPA